VSALARGDHVFSTSCDLDTGWSRSLDQAFFNASPFIFRFLLFFPPLNPDLT
jgi:hypothetical protein